MYWLTIAALSVLSIYSHDWKPEWYPFTKPLPIATLLYLLIRNYVSNSIFANGILIGMIFGLAGDVLLLKSYEKKFFLFGLISFLCGHISYIITFMLETQWSLSTRFVAAYFAFLVVYAKVLLGKLPKNGMLVPITAYFFTIGLMCLCAFNVDAANASTIPLMSLGGVLFIISDSVICWNKFISSFPHADVLILGTYYPAQACILAGALLRMQQNLPENIYLPNLLDFQFA